MILAGNLERRCSNICSRDVSGLAFRNSDRRPPFIIKSLRASRGSAVSAGGGAELPAEISADVMMPVYLTGQAGLRAAAGDFLKIEMSGRGRHASGIMGIWLQRLSQRRKRCCL